MRAAKMPPHRKIRLPDSIYLRIYYYFYMIFMPAYQQIQNNMKKFLKIVFAAFLGSAIALFIGGFVFMSVIISMAAFSTEEPVSVAPGSVLKIDFSSDITDKSNKDPLDGIFPFQGGNSISLLSAVTAIEKAASDPAIKLIYLNTDRMRTSMAQTEELRNALTEFRKSGKPVIAYASNYNSQDAYYLATAADKIYADPLGMIPLSGMSAQMLFFKRLFDKAGIEVQLVRHGKFKAAAEQYVNDRISPENKEQTQAYLESLWQSRAEAISSSREIDPEKLDEMIDGLQLCTTEDALHAGLIDSLMYDDQLKEKLCLLADKENYKDINFISLEKYAKAVIIPDTKAKDEIAVVYASGDIVAGSNDNAIASNDFIKTLSSIRQNESVKAVVLRVDSPGGDAQAAEMIARELRLLNDSLPLIVSFGNYAASGGYWISAESDYIFTDRSTITGSIGVFGMVPNMQKTFEEKLHINIETINTNSNSDILSTLRPMTAAEERFMQRNIENIYGRFLEIVAQGRGMTEEEVDEIAQGRVWAGADAVSLGLADSFGGIADAIEYAASEAGIERYKITEYPKHGDSIDKLLKKLYSVSQGISIFESPESTLGSFVSKIEAGKGKAMARMPFDMIIK